MNITNILQYAGELERVAPCHLVLLNHIPVKYTKIKTLREERETEETLREEREGETEIKLALYADDALLFLEDLDHTVPYINLFNS